MAKPRKKARKAALIDNCIRPTAERLAQNDMQSAGMAKRVTAVIDILARNDKIDARRHTLLGYYRDQCHAAEDANATQGPLSAERIMGGVSHGSSGSRVPRCLLGQNSAMLEVARIERDLGPLRAIARAIAVDDMTMTGWCIYKYGGRERYDGQGRFVAMVPRCGQDAINMEWQDLKMAADRIVLGLDARR